MSNQTPSHSSAWVMQVWVAFAISLGGMGWCITDSPLDYNVKIWMGIGFLFAVSSTLTLSKTLRDVHENNDQYTKVWMIQVFVAFFVSVSGFAWGLYTLPFHSNIKVMMGLIAIFSLSSSSALAKTARDQENAKQQRTE